MTAKSSYVKVFLRRGYFPEPNDVEWPEGVDPKPKLVPEDLPDGKVMMKRDVAKRLHAAGVVVEVGSLDEDD